MIFNTNTGWMKKKIARKSVKIKNILKVCRNGLKIFQFKAKSSANDFLKL